MKISHVFVPLVFLLAAQSIPSATAKTNDLVYDIAGEKVRNDFTYYIGPVNSAGGGIKLSDAKNGKKTCPLNVVQDPQEVSQGDDFFFTMSANTYEKRLVRVEYPLGIDSGDPTGSCNKSTFWKIDKPEEKAPANFITTGGEFESQESCFQLVKYPKPTNAKVHSYMLQHCPTFCGAVPQPCFNISIYYDSGMKHLAATRTGKPFEFVLKAGITMTVV